MTISRRLIWTGHVAVKLEGKRPFGRPKRVWEDNIKIDLEVGYENVKWIELGGDRVQGRVLVNPVINIQV
jgi:hypothetical protein